jgi:hypothetical protein
MKKFFFAGIVFLFFFSTAIAAAIDSTNLILTATERINAGETISIHTETANDRQPVIKIFDSRNTLITTITPPAPTKIFDTTYKLDNDGSYRVSATIEPPCSNCKATAMVNVEKKKQSNVPETNLAIIVLVSIIVLVATRKNKN